MKTVPPSHDWTIPGLSSALTGLRRVDPRTDATSCRLAGDIPGRTATLHLHADDPHAIHFALDDAAPPAADCRPWSECGSVVSVADLALILGWWLTRRGRHDEDEPRPRPARRVGGSVA